MDDILIAAPSMSQVDQAVSTVSETLKTNGFEIASAKIKKGPCVTFLGVGISSSYITPPQIKIHRDIKTLHDTQQLVGSLQWLRNIVLIPPEVMDPLNDLLKGKNSWEKKTLTPEATRSLDFIEQQISLEAAAIVLACGLFPEEHLNIITDSIFMARLCLAMSGPGVAVSTVAMMLEEALFARKGTISVIQVNSHNPVKGFFQIGNDKADAAAKGLWMLRDARQLHESLHIGAKALAKKCGISTADAKHIVATCPHCQKSPLWSNGVNPRGLKASEIWQTDFTLCQLLKPRAWLAVTVDTYSGVIIATQHLKTDSKATIQHWLTEYSAADNPHNCKWDTPWREITLSQVTGRGKCFGSVTLAKQMSNICAEFIQPSQKTDKWAVPFLSGMWVCQQSGITPCVYLGKFNNLADFYVQVLIIPRVLYHEEEEMYRFLEETIQLHTREVITGITIAMLLGLGAAGAAAGVSALVTQHQGLSQLQMTIDEDLLRIEKSISFLEKSVSSLSEVILQNRRGLDLLLMQQGGLCAALKEECCFYADHTGVVRDSMVELRERLAQRKREREAQQGWFESWLISPHG
ncbi:hypothetical protein DUI87_34269 [Hirundo rustica rustica]|uniref:ribonuclease H n=1 Tax=Hirundo rustica rustica TaxID=333673 RepID=A0A3M0IK19_HIRRU|nr:hypothetical protein DUI87_34268 [Hirundo rustica rustica]RMB89357.1 hypothetical protein DUI87_34269 [Hirundo rustica rustica]